MTKIIIINAGELKSVLAGFSKIINTRHSLEALCSLRIRGDEAGLFLEGTDSESHLKARIGSGEENIDAFLAPFAKLKEFVRRLPSYALVRIAPECFQSDLGTGTLEERFEVIDPTTFPEEPNINAPLNLMPAEFVGEFRQALGCSSDDQASLTSRAKGRNLLHISIWEFCFGLQSLFYIDFIGVMKILILHDPWKQLNILLAM